MARTAGSHSDITGPRIRAAALKLFAQHGYAAVSMRQIAGDVGVQAGALYNYTPDKQTLLFELMHQHMEELLLAMPQAAGGAPMQELETFVRFHIAFHRARPDAVFLAYMELRSLDPENFAKVEAQRSKYEARLQDILQSGVACKEMDVPEPKITAMAVIAMLTGVNTWFREEGRLSLEAVQDEYWRMVRRLVARPACSTVNGPGE